jgi:hypothetical protein
MDPAPLSVDCPVAMEIPPLLLADVPVDNAIPFAPPDKDKLSSPRTCASPPITFTAPRVSATPDTRSTLPLSVPTPLLIINEPVALLEELPLVTEMAPLTLRLLSPEAIARDPEFI